MSLRLIELYLPTDEDPSWVKEQISKFPIHGIWQDRISESQNLIRVLVDSGESGEILDYLEKDFSDVKGFRIVLLPVEATIPRININSNNETEQTNKGKFKIGKGISREELYSDISENAETSGFFIFLVLLSTLVASIGILKNNVAVLIGAMMIAPLIGPNVSLAFSTTLGDKVLFMKSLKANFVGFAVAFVISIILGVALDIDTQISEISSRTKVGIEDIVIALASGSAGALSFTMGLPSTIIGVMVAVALLPPTVSFGLFAGSGNYPLALGALLLLFVNVICINLSGVLTFLIQGVRPLTWWESDKAKKATQLAIIFWSLSLLVLFILILKLF